MQSSIASVVQYIPGTQVANIGLPTAQQNFANARNSASSFDDAQGTNFNPAQHGSVSDVLQRGSTDECMQGALNPQLSYHNWTSMQPSNAIQANAIILQQRKRKDMELMRHRQELLRKHQRVNETPHAIESTSVHATLTRINHSPIRHHLLIIGRQFIISIHWLHLKLLSLKLQVQVHLHCCLCYQNSKALMEIRIRYNLKFQLSQVKGLWIACSKR